MTVHSPFMFHHCEGCELSAPPVCGFSSGEGTAKSGAFTEQKQAGV